MIQIQIGAAICWQFWHAWFDRCQHRLARSGLGHGPVPYGHTQLYGRHEGQWEVMKVSGRSYEFTTYCQSQPGISRRKIFMQIHFVMLKIEKIV